MSQPTPPFSSSALNVLPADSSALPAGGTATPPMISPATQRGLAMVSVAVGAGLAGDWLFSKTALGVNLLVWLSLVTSATLMVVRRESADEKVIYRLVFPLGFFALGFAWRDSATLHGLNLLAMAMILLIIAIRTQRGRATAALISDYVLMGLVLAIESTFGSLILLTGDIRWGELPRDGWSRYAFAVAKGLVIALPILLVFGVLLMAADAAFENLIVKTFSFNLETAMTHALWISCLSWTVGGILHGLLSSSAVSSHWPATAPANNKTSFVSLGIIETSIVLGLLNLLFLAFVLVQFSYLFQHGATIALNDSPAFSAYARRGFFELVWVSLLVLPLLLGAHWILRKDEPRNEKIFRGLAGVQIALLFVIMASAVQRMLLYHNCCGLTELRIYTLAFQAWLAVVFLWFCATVLRGQRARFAFGAAIAALVVVAFLNVLNPDAMIARVNLARARVQTHPDIPYVASLSADAVPALIEGMANLKASDQQSLNEYLQTRDWSGGARGWRGWNWARVRAIKAVQALPRQ